MASTPPRDGFDRRAVLRQAACVAASAGLGDMALAATAAPNQATSPAPSQPNVARKAYLQSLLVDRFGRPIKAKALVTGVAHVFAWPYVATPAFLVALDRPVSMTPIAPGVPGKPAGAPAGPGVPYNSPSGAGADRRIVAFSAICTHKLVYPTKQVSFIGLRAGQGQEPAHVIHCCSDGSRYDPHRGAQVLAGPAPAPLAAIELAWDDKTDALHAVAVLGQDRFEAFFEKYAFKLEMDHGRPQARALCGQTTVVFPAAEYSKQGPRCSI